MDSLLKIGDFARLARVTVKTLRHYAGEGLLAPRHVDPKTGYRYYEARQLRDLNLILNLREAGLSLAEIRRAVSADHGPSLTAALLKARRESLEREKALIERRIRLVDALARAAGAERILSHVRLSMTEPRLAHTVRATVPSLGAPVTEIFERAEAAVAAFSARALTSPFLLFHDPAPRSADIDLEACVPVDAPSERIGTRLVPGDELCCSAIYSGSYAQTDAIRRRLADWLAGAGLVAVGPAREVYHRFGADLDGYDLPAEMLAARTEDYITEIQIAVAPAPDEEKDRS